MDPEHRADYVERFARLLERTGEARITGRIYAHLATAQEPYLSLQELADQVGVSRASVSTNTRRLIALRILTRVAVPGSRGEHYAVNSAGAHAMLENAAEMARSVAELASEGVEMQRDVVTPGTQSLRWMAEVYVDLAAAFERLADQRSTSPAESQVRRSAR